MRGAPSPPPLTGATVAVCVWGGVLGWLGVARASDPPPIPLRL